MCEPVIPETKVLKFWVVRRHRLGVSRRRWASSVIVLAVADPGLSDETRSRVHFHAQTAVNMPLPLELSGTLIRNFRVDRAARHQRSSRSSLESLDSELWP